VSYVDSSAFIKLFVEEQGSVEMKQFMADVVSTIKPHFTTSAVTKAEIMAGLAAIRRGRHITQRQFEESNDVI
jgi:uncharacterized protein with PIN domain